MCVQLVWDFLHYQSQLLLLSKNKINNFFLKKGLFEVTIKFSNIYYKLTSKFLLKKQFKVLRILSCDYLMILCFINNAIITWSKPKQRKAKLSLSDLSTHKKFSFIIHLYCYFFRFLFRFKIDRFI